MDGWITHPTYKCNKITVFYIVVKPGGIFAAVKVAIHRIICGFQ